MRTKGKDCSILQAHSVVASHIRNHSHNALAPPSLDNSFSKVKPILEVLSFFALTTFPL